MRRWFPLDSDGDQQYPFCNNANCAVRRTVWERLQYDESLSGLEGYRLGMSRLFEEGHRLSYVAEAAVVHVHQESFSTIINRYRREAMAYRRILHDERFPMVEAISRVSPTYLGNMSAMKRRVLLQNLLGIPRFRSAQFWGAYPGLGTRRQSGRDSSADSTTPRASIAYESRIRCQENQVGGDAPLFRCGMRASEYRERLSRPSRQATVLLCT